jgi:N6-L-threonylcarbamoyladenine synthase
LKKHPDALKEVGVSHLCASYQEAIFDALVNGSERAIRRERAIAFACVGGVARNRRLRAKLDDLCRKLGVRLVLTPPEYCTDNAAMVAALAGARPRPEETPAALDVHPNWGLARR